MEKLKLLVPNVTKKPIDTKTKFGEGEINGYVGTEFGEGTIFMNGKVIPDETPWGVPTLTAVQSEDEGDQNNATY